MRPWIARALKRLAIFHKVRDGSVGVILALTAVPLLLATGISIDLGRAYLVKERLTNTADKAGLALGAASSSADLDTLLSNFFNANFPSDSIGSVTETSYTNDGTTITISATASVTTTFMQLLGRDTISVTASSEITVQEDSLEVVLVLDNSGSMSGSKLTSLKSAANSLLDILFGDETTSTQVKIGLVPFSNNVNIGNSNTGYVSDPTVFNWYSDEWQGCVEAQTTDDEDTKDDYTGTWTPFYWPDDSNNNWYYSGSDHISSSRGPNLYCPDQEIVPLTNVKSTLTTAIDGMAAYGGTHINWGAIWGWRVVSPSEPFTEGAAYGTTDNTKAVIILTDGANTAYSFVYDAFGYPSDERLGSGINTASEVADEIDDRLATICTNMKAEGVIVYTITFSLSDTDTQDIFETCATDTNKYYDSPSTSELERTFRAIAAELKKLHISG